MEIHVTVDGQRMTFEDSGYRFAPRTQKFIKYKFDLSEDWSPLTVFAQFTQGENSYNSYLDYDDCVYLPSEITAGECYMMLYGTGANEVRGTTNAIRMCITEDRFVEDAQSTVITQSLYDQLIAQLQDYLTTEHVASVAEVKEALGI